MWTETAHCLLFVLFSPPSLRAREHLLNNKRSVDEHFISQTRTHQYLHCTLLFPRTAAASLSQTDLGGGNTRRRRKAVASKRLIAVLWHTHTASQCLDIYSDIHHRFLHIVTLPRTDEIIQYHNILSADPSTDPRLLSSNQGQPVSTFSLNITRFTYQEYSKKRISGEDT